MKRAVASVVAGMMVLASAGAVIAAPQDTQAARGTVSAVTGNSLTVMVKDQPMKFIVDATTDVVAPGGGTATRAAKADGKTGVAITTVVKVGRVSRREPRSKARWARPGRTTRPPSRPSTSTTSGQSVTATSSP